MQPTYFIFLLFFVFLVDNLPISVFLTRILHCGLCFLWTAYLFQFFVVFCVSCGQPTYLCVSDKNLALWVFFFLDNLPISVLPTRILHCGLCSLWTAYLSLWFFVLFVCFLWTTYLSLCFQQESCTVGCVSCGQAISMFLCMCFFVCFKKKKIVDNLPISVFLTTILQCGLCF